MAGDSKCESCEQFFVHPEKKCCPQEGAEQTDHSPIVLIGNYKVGKSTLFSMLSSPAGGEIKIGGKKSAATRGRIPSLASPLYDTPATASIFSSNEEEGTARELLLAELDGEEPGRILVVGDAKNLNRAVSLLLPLAEFGLPMVLAINMVDEAEERGIEIQTEKLARMLKIRTVRCVARDSVGVGSLVSELSAPGIPGSLVHYPERIEQFLGMFQKLMGKGRFASRGAGLLFLWGDPHAARGIERTRGREVLEQLQRLAEACRNEEALDIGVILGNIYNRRAGEIVGATTEAKAPAARTFSTKLASWCMTPFPGLFIAAMVVSLMYLFVGSFGATFLVDLINTRIFQGIVIPFTTELIEPVPSAFIRDMLVDPDFGILPTGVFLALGLVLPVLFCFYIAFGILEDSGYLSRLAILLDRLLRKMGLNGKGVIPLAMGFSCVTMALLTTRLLDTRKEKNIASFLLLLGMPCAPLLAVMLVILDKMSISASITVFGLIFLQIVTAGYLADKLLSGRCSRLIMELSPLRVPRPGIIIKMAFMKTYCFIKEALPVFVIASLIVFLFERAGGLAFMERICAPLVNDVMGLPAKSVQVFIKTIIRRESGATEIQHLSQIYDNVQLVVNLLVMTFLTPCINASIVLFKERGPRVACTILVSAMFYALFVGTVVNHACRFFGVTFT